MAPSVIITNANFALQLKLLNATAKSSQNKLKPVREATTNRHKT